MPSDGAATRCVGAFRVTATGMAILAPEPASTLGPPPSMWTATFTPNAIRQTVTARKNARKYQPISNIRVRKDANERRPNAFMVSTLLNRYTIKEYRTTIYIN